MTFRRLRRWVARPRGLPLIVASALVSLTVLTPTGAAASSSVVWDAKGDALSATESAHRVGAGVPADTARGYLDILSASVKKTNGRYVFSTVLAAPVPKDMSKENCYGRTGPAGDTTTITVGPADCFFAWNWDVSDGVPNMSTNPASPTVRWINGAFQGIVFYAGAPAATFDTFTIDGARITATVDERLIPDAVRSSFNFQAVSRNHRVDFGGNGAVGVADSTSTGSYADLSAQFRAIPGLVAAIQAAIDAAFANLSPWDRPSVADILR